jgi:hypothetical protein
MLRFFALFVFLGVAFLPHSVFAETLTYPDLVHRLTDLQHLATPPAVGEKTSLASSYDRASTYDPATDTYHRWDSNGDGGGIVRQEGDESVLMDVSGPGCIWRTWSATPGPGHVKIFLDGATTPVVDLPFTGYFDHSTAPFTRPHLVYHTPSNGFDNFTPIPFQKSCKIVADKNWGAYYHFNYTQFPADTVVPTFTLPLSPDDEKALDDADTIMANAGTKPNADLPGETTDKLDVTAPAHAAATVDNVAGAGAITALKVKFALPADPAALKDLLRELVVRISWDGEAKPSVSAPLGDFFANAMFAVKYSNLVTGRSDDGQFYMYWYMPFASGAHIEIRNDGADPLPMSWEVSHAPLDAAKAGSLLRFHAKWHRDAFVPTRRDREPDWTLLTTQGIGRYVGTQLHVWNPRGGWWGEGDEKFFVDGEKFPSTFGTGSEDYFGFAWSSGSPFHEPLHGQPSNEGNNGHASLYRWHIADDIPFQNGFEGCLEKYFPNDRPTLFDAVAFWYLAPGGTDPYPEIPVDQRIGYWNPPPPVTPLPGIIQSEPDSAAPETGPGIIEGESLKPVSGDPEIQGMGGWKTGIWSGNAQLWWRPSHVHAMAEVQLPAAEAGAHHLVIRFTQAPDYGIIQFSVNGTKAGGPIDLYGPTVAPTKPIDLGLVNLQSGTNTLSMEAVGSDKGGCDAGIDYIKLTAP